MADTPPLFADLLEASLHGGPFVHDEGEVLSLHFSLATVQTLVNLQEPAKLMLGYTRAMMAGLLLQTNPARIGLIGLGGGAMVHYCQRYLPDSDLTVAEINPEVIALRDTFLLPADHAHFRIECADGADFVQNAEHEFDLLFVDGFDEGGQPDQLSSTYFYDGCRQRLSADGVLVVNLWEGLSRYPVYLNRIREVFGQVYTLKSDDSANRIALASNHPLPNRRALLNRARELVQTQPLDFVTMAEQIQMRAD